LCARIIVERKGDLVVRGRRLEGLLISARHPCAPAFGCTAVMANPASVFSIVSVAVVLMLSGVSVVVQVIVAEHGLPDSLRDCWT
jgi:hypothetical protein